jgi:hypothetical protein
VSSAPLTLPNRLFLWQACAYWVFSRPQLVAPGPAFPKTLRENSNGNSPLRRHVKNNWPRAAGRKGLPVPVVAIIGPINR